MSLIRSLPSGTTPALLLACAMVACSSSGGSTSEPAPTLVTVAPSSFGQDLVCGDFPGAWKSYVVTLIDVTDPNAPFALPSSAAVPCEMPVSFAWVVPGRKYAAEIDLYDETGRDLTPWGPGSPTMQNDEGDVTPRWSTQCGKEPGKSATATLQSNVAVQHCDPLEVRSGSEVETGIVLEIATVLDGLSCGAEPGQIDVFEVRPQQASLEADVRTVSCDADATIEFTSIEPDTKHGFDVKAFEAGQAEVRWATHCEAYSKDGLVLPASCDPLTDRGALTIDVQELLSASGRVCSADDVVTYRAVLLGTGGLGKAPRACTEAITFNDLPPSTHQAVVEGLDANGQTVFEASCEGTVEPASVTPMTCQGSP